MVLWYIAENQLAITYKILSWGLKIFSFVSLKNPCIDQIIGAGSAHNIFCLNVNPFAITLIGFLVILLIATSLARESRMAEGGEYLFKEKSYTWELSPLSNAAVLALKE